ncbi:hypothetical protein M758_8G145400, partial [Ceratodon purpureus]
PRNRSILQTNETVAPEGEFHIIFQLPSDSASNQNYNLVELILSLLELHSSLSSVHVWQANWKRELEV